ncbi:hypothetical protein JOC75_004315 [Metabacillus crassostreae]|uniref:hypothetical protein n=1 Tax=Metabacillus crassostreae TaxID=929098 RepID=UPI00195E15E2|nr:hypothetical protein [Metabacillus crassostreae]MBM7606267.1 hypothetical protein [Metabacillus crassostreae]
MDRFEDKYYELKRLNERLIEDKVEMEQEFKEILSHIVDEVDSAGKDKEKSGSGNLSMYKELKASGILKGKLFVNTINELEVMNDKLLLELKLLKDRYSKLEKSKLGRIQKKWWLVRKKINKFF